MDSKKSQPYSGNLFNGENNINLYIYIWNLTSAYRSNPSEKRIQIPSTVNNIWINRPITSTDNTIILRIYNTPSRIHLYTSWDPIPNINHGQKSCYVQIEDLTKAITNGICSFKDKNGYPIFAIHPEYLANYISILESNNTVSMPVDSTPLKDTIWKYGDKKRKKRILKSIEELQKKITSLHTT